MAHVFVDIDYRRFARDHRCAVVPTIARQLSDRRLPGEHGNGHRQARRHDHQFIRVSVARSTADSLEHDARSAEAFIAGRHFILSVLAASQRALAQHFARSAADKFAGWEKEFEAGIGGCPRLRHSVATFECVTYSRHQEGDHTILLGRVEHHSRTEAAPILLHRGEMGSLWDLAERLNKPA